MVRESGNKLGREGFARAVKVSKQPVKPARGGKSSYHSPFSLPAASQLVKVDDARWVAPVLPRA